MQFPVPQFTDVEDRIIGGLSFKQFGIVFAAAVFTFVMYIISNKNIPVAIVTGIVTGVPALALTFGKLNGRPLYASAGNFVKYLFGAKIYVFHKQGQTISETDKTAVIVEQQPEPKDPKATTIKIKELNYLLQQQASEENMLLQRIRENKAAAK